VFVISTRSQKIRTFLPFEKIAHVTVSVSDSYFECPVGYWLYSRQ